MDQTAPVRPGSYRRPTFEPINLADADFAASNPAPRGALHGCLPPADSGGGTGGLPAAPALKQRPSLQEEEETVSLSEEKPDLIDCDKVKQAAADRRLPDVTTSILPHQLPPDLVDIDNGIHHCNNINSSLNINNFNNKVNSSFVVDKLVPDDYNNSVVEIDISRISNEAANSGRELIHQKDTATASYFASAVSRDDSICSDLPVVDQQIGALKLDNNNGDDYISDPSGVEISLVEEIEQVEEEQEEEKEKEKEEVKLQPNTTTSSASNTIDSEGNEELENREQSFVDSISIECLSVGEVSVIAVENQSTNFHESKIIEPIEEKQLVDKSVPVIDEIQSVEIQVKKDCSQPAGETELEGVSGSGKCENDKHSEPLVGFKPFSEPYGDDELDKYLEELEILEKEEKEQTLSEDTKAEETLKEESVHEITSEEASTGSGSDSDETAELQDIIDHHQSLEKPKEPASSGISRSLSDFIEKDVAEDIKEESTKELQVEIDKQNALLDYYNSNGQQVSSLAEVSQFAFPVANVECKRDTSTLNSVSCASGSESFNNIKPLECQVAVGHKQESGTELSTAEAPVGSCESSTDSSSLECDSMGNTSEKLSAAGSEAGGGDSPIAAVGEEGWSSSSEDVKTDDGPVADTADDSDKPSRPNFLQLPARITIDNNVVTSPTPSATPSIEESEDGLIDASGPRQVSSVVANQDGVISDDQLGRVKPLWVPDMDAPNCMQCQLKFGIIKRRHHCRACGKVLCSKCCSMKAKLLFMEGEEARVCQRCYNILERDGPCDGARSPLGRQPNPNNPMEYCSTIPPLQQVAGSLPQAPPSVLVPVGVLKREGRAKSDVTKQVMFSDGIRPGGDLTELDGSTETKLPFRRPGRMMKRVGTPPGGHSSRTMRRPMDPVTSSFIPSEGEKNLPPTVVKSHGELIYSEFENTAITSNQPPLKFAINRNLFVHVKRVLLACCVNRDCWCITSEGLACVGQDEIILVLECLPDEMIPPKDVFLLINSLYEDASKGNTVSELSFSPAFSNNLLGWKDHGGFLYIRPTHQCTDQLILPNPPYLVALLIHRWETPWARLFPIRLELRLGAEFRYYPCPLVSVRHRPSLYTDIGHTIISLLADFRLYNYTLPVVRGLVVHMEDRQTTILIPRNRYDQVVRALNNSNDSVLPFGANFSLAADSHLVCMQSLEDENTYHTQAINIQNKPRKVTGASFVVFNGALKTSGMTGKSSIVEDGLMVQVASETMTALRTALRDMHDYTITCGPPHAEETVLLKWTADDTNFNIGVKSMIDGRPLDGVPSMRVHSGIDFSGNLRIIRWTEVFILQSEEQSGVGSGGGGGGKAGAGAGDPVDISRLSESLAQATCLALVPFLDLLAAAGLTAVAVRANIHPDNVGYEAGSGGERLPPLYMKTLDEELVAVLHEAAVAAHQSPPAILELIFRVMQS
ncbi:uncharacterized protein LOC111051534 isoform X2 [Nilaparvata lugens]|uniref:uncharacterized protein LOC111051534 isoform X2 n=1 Tax=Nilaparvata lugens TaxID=108931 RepID=UPI00193D5A76|nr:uncharacterized protein LOC111051534 isoform X2 [Nilaparvata lugens]